MLLSIHWILYFEYETIKFLIFLLNHILPTFLTDTCSGQIGEDNNALTVFFIGILNVVNEQHNRIWSLDPWSKLLVITFALASVSKKIYLFFWSKCSLMNSVDAWSYHFPNIFYTFYSMLQLYNKKIIIQMSYKIFMKR